MKLQSKALNMNIDYLYLIIALGLTSSLVLSLGAMMLAKISWFSIAIFSVLIFLIHWAMDKGYKIYFKAIAFLLVIVFIGMMFKNKTFYEGVLHHSKEIIMWIRELMKFRAEENWIYATSLGYFLVIPILFLVKKLMRYRYKTALLSIPAMIMFTYHWSLYLASAWIYALVYCLFLIALHSIDNYHLITKTASSQGRSLNHFDYRIWISTTRNILIILLVFVVLMPKAIEPIESSFFNELYDRIDTTFNLKGRFQRTGGTVTARFGLDTLGFSQSSTNLGGPANPSKELVLRVKSPIATYLRGTVKTQYTGKSWEYYTDEQLKFNGSNIIIENSYSEGVTPKYVMLEIEMENFKTSTLFSPLQPRVIRSKGGTNYVTPEAEVYGRKELKKGDKYYVVATMAEFNKENLPDTEDYDYQWVGEYLNLPENMPEGVIEKVQDILMYYQPTYMPTEGQQDYIVKPQVQYEIASAIRDFLRSNYTYNLNTSYLPPGRDFVDYFLNDEKEGYCTYFATSMAVMARIAGIPSRYVEGFIMPSYTDEEGMYNVTGDLAHAWAELYFEGFGWVPFEATPAYATDYEIAVIEDEIDPGEWYLDPNDPGTFNPQPQQPTDPGTDNPVVDEPDTGKGTITISNKLIVFIIIGLGILIFIIVLIIRKKGINKIRTTDIIGGVEKNYLIIIRALNKIGFEIKDGETPLEYAQRIKDSSILAEVDILGITDIFYRSRYGKEELSTHQINLVSEGCKRVLALLKDKLGLLSYSIELIKIEMKKG